MKKKNLHELFHDEVLVKLIIGALPPSNIEIRDVTANSTKCHPHDIFVATRGATTTSKDGHDFIDHAIKNGAAYVVVNRDFSPAKNYDVPLIRVLDSKTALCHLAEAFHDYPSSRLKIVGITGTNGKTSTSFMLHNILKTAGFTPRIMGTLGMGDPRNLSPLSHTTMDPEFISRTLSSMADEGVTHVIMEISSHALSLKRVEALDFFAVGLTNITQDHLDFHGNLWAYQKAKSRLFTELAHEKTIKVLPVDHPFVDEIGSYTPIGKNTAYFYDDVREQNDQTMVDFYLQNEKVTVALPFLGAFHANNACLSAALAHEMNINLHSIAKGLSTCPFIPGRLELVANKFSRKVFVDFAHTPDALSSLLKTARTLNRDGKLIIVFGCGGDRDRMKRPLMGKIAEALADIVIVTDDNPRTEDAHTIRKEIVAGMTNKTKALVIEKRDEAINHAIRISKKNDTVVIAGKGHENYQIYGTTSYAFSDRAHAQRVLDSL